VESGEWRVESGEWRVESGEWRVESGEWRMESGEWRVESGEYVSAGLRRVAVRSRGEPLRDRPQVHWPRDQGVVLLQVGG